MRGGVPDPRRIRPSIQFWETGVFRWDEFGAGPMEYVAARPACSALEACARGRSGRPPCAGFRRLGGAAALSASSCRSRAAVAPCGQAAVGRRGAWRRRCGHQCRRNGRQRGRPHRCQAFFGAAIALPKKAWRWSRDRHAPRFPRSPHQKPSAAEGLFESRLLANRGVEPVELRVVADAFVGALKKHLPNAHFSRLGSVRAASADLPRRAASSRGRRAGLRLPARARRRGGCYGDEHRSAHRRRSPAAEHHAAPRSVRPPPRLCGGARRELFARRSPCRGDPMPAEPA